MNAEMQQLTGDALPNEANVLNSLLEQAIKSTEWKDDKQFVEAQYPFLKLEMGTIYHFVKMKNVETKGFEQNVPGISPLCYLVEEIQPGGALVQVGKPVLLPAVAMMKPVLDFPMAQAFKLTFKSERSSEGGKYKELEIKVYKPRA
jgi:hypothetical protein